MGSNDIGHLEIDGCDALDLAREHGTPLWVVSERTIRHNYRTLLHAFRGEYGRSRLVYASKANPEPAVVRIAWQEGALVDVVTMGHIELALAAGVPPSALVFNGNSKTLEELRWAAEHGMAYVNVDSLEEIEALARSVPDGAPPFACVSASRLTSDPSPRPIRSSPRTGAGRSSAWTRTTPSPRPRSQPSTRASSSPVFINTSAGRSTERRTTRLSTSSVTWRRSSR